MKETKINEKEAVIGPFFKKKKYTLKRIQLLSDYYTVSVNVVLGSLHLRLVQMDCVKRSGIESFLTPCVFCMHKNWTTLLRKPMQITQVWTSHYPQSAFTHNPGPTFFNLQFYDLNSAIFLYSITLYSKILSLFASIITYRYYFQLSAYWHISPLEYFKLGYFIVAPLM